MLTGIGRWLRQQREARGWARREMANRLIQAAQAAGDAAVPGIEHLETYIRRWESGRHGPTERYVMYYSTAFGIRPSQFGTAPLPPPKTLAPAPEVSPQSPGTRPVPITAATLDLSEHHLTAPEFVAHHAIDGADVDNIAVGQDVVTAAHDATDLAEQAEQHRVGDTTLEQLRADVRRLARLSDTGGPSAVFADMRRVRDRTARLLARRLRPCEQADVYFLLGCLHGLMGNIAVRLGHPDPAEELIRAGWAHADLIGHGPLRAQLRTLMSALMYWRGRYAEARELALDGLRYVRQGWPGACLHLRLLIRSLGLGETVDGTAADGALVERVLGLAPKGRCPGADGTEPWLTGPAEDLLSVGSIVALPRLLQAVSDASDAEMATARQVVIALFRYLPLMMRMLGAMTGDDNYAGLAAIGQMGQNPEIIPYIVPAVLAMLRAGWTDNLNAVTSALQQFPELAARTQQLLDMPAGTVESNLASQPADARERVQRIIDAAIDGKLEIPTTGPA